MASGWAADGAVQDQIDESFADAVRLARVDALMQDVWGLADSTRQQRCRMIGRFLLKQFGARPVAISAINAAAVRRFVLGGEEGGSAGTIRVKGGAIGCYLRFRAISGDRVAELLTAIPRAAHWRLASLPEVLTGSCPIAWCS